MLAYKESHSVSFPKTILKSIHQQKDMYLNSKMDVPCFLLVPFSESIKYRTPEIKDKQVLVMDL